MVVVYGVVIRRGHDRVHRGSIVKVRHEYKDALCLEGVELLYEKVDHVYCWGLWTVDEYQECT